MVVFPAPVGPTMATIWPGRGLDQISAFVLYSRKFSGPINEIAGITIMSPA